MQIEVITDSKEAGAWVKRCPEKHPVLAEVSLLVWRGSVLQVLHEDGVPLSYNVTYFGKRRKNIWEPYANWYTAYTVTEHRRKGYARWLADLARQEATGRGCRRLKALAGTRLGLLLHAGLNDHFWGIKETAEVLVDTPLVPLPEYLDAAPPTALVPRRQSLAEVLTALGNRKLRYDR